MLGFVNLNKPAGLTSHDCVAKIRRQLRLKKIGHGGTLDPAATGVLPIAVGGATRLLSYLPRAKAYRAKIRLGVKTATDDLEGEVIQTKPAPELTLERVIPVLSQFEGQIEQIPPIYSAIQQGGKRLYQLARSGQKVEVPPRKVEIDRIEVLDFHGGEYPELELMVSCGPGTYIRAIARDIGENLGVGGTLAQLTRTLSCGLEISQSLTFPEIERQLETGEFKLIEPRIALKHLPEITLATAEAKRWCQGQRLSLKTIKSWESGDFLGIVRVINTECVFLGVGQIIEGREGNILSPKIVLESV